MSAPSAGKSLAGKLSPGRLALALALFQFVLGLALGAFHELGGYDSETDFYSFYVPGARALAAGEPYTPTRSGPAFSALLAAASELGLDVFTAAKLLAAASVALLGLASFHVGARLAGARAGLVLQGLVYVVLLRFSFVAGNDVLAAMLAWAALALVCRREAPPTLEWLAAGLIAGVSFLTRYTGVALLAVLPPALLLRPVSWRWRGIATGGFVAGALACVVPWMLVSYAWFGRPLNNQAQALIALDAFGRPERRLDGNELYAMEQRFGSLGEVLAHDPAGLVAHYSTDFVTDAGQVLRDLVTFPACLLGAVGVVLLLRRTPKAPRWPLGLVSAFTALAFASAALVPYQSRYYFPILPALLLPVAVAMTEPWGRSARAQGLRKAGAALSVLVLAGASLWKTHEYLTGEPTELIETARSLAPHVRPGDRLIARKPQLGHLAGLEVVPLPPGDVERILGLARERGVRFLYVGPREVRQNGALAPLMKGTDLPPGLRLLHEHAEPQGRLYLLE